MSRNFYTGESCYVPGNDPGILRPDFRPDVPSPNDELRQLQPQSELPRTRLHLNPLLTVKSRNLYYIKDITNTFKILIDTGAGISIFKEKTAEKFSNKFSENAIIQGITNEKILIKESKLIPFKAGDPHKVYIYNLDIEFDGLLGSDFLEHYGCVIDIKNKKLITNFKTVPLFKAGDDSGETPVVNKNTQFNENFTKNIISIQPRTEQVFKLKCNLISTDAILLAQEKEKVRLPNALVKINEKGEFLTSIINANAMPKTIDFSDLKLEPVTQYELACNINVSNINSNQFQNDTTDRQYEIQNQLRLEHLNDEERESIVDLCLKFSDIFYLEGDSLTFTNEIKHAIDTNNAKPVFTKSYRYPQIHKEEVKRQITEMLNQGIIQPSISPWSSPVWVVPKKIDASGKQKWRVVIDYRKLNELTINDKYPLPNISDLLDQLGKCEYFTTLDLASGFHQIEIDKKDIQKTAFSVENGHYEFVRMPFGLKNAPSTFQRVMDNILLGIQNERCLVYMDDIIIYSPTIHEHISRLTEVFKRLRKANLKIQPDKCEFLRKEVAYLGHLITQDGVKPNPSKIDCIRNFPEPKTQKEIKSFLGLAGYYRRFISNFAKISKPLTKLLQKDIPFNFDSNCKNSFEELKTALTSTPILIYPNFDETFLLTTDASAYAIGAVLSQGPIGKDLPIAYASRTLCNAETKYSTIERELLAIVWAVKHYRPYLFGRRFKLITDHRPLTWLFSIKDPGSRLARWRLKLEEYDYEIVYKPGKINKNADALSRIKVNNIQKCVAFHNNIENLDDPPDPDNTSDEDIPPEQVAQEYETFEKLYQTKSLIDYSKIRFSNNQLLDKDHKNIITFFQQDNLQDFHYKIIEDILEEDPDFTNNKINILSSKTVRKRSYHIIPLPFDPTSAILQLFITVYKNQNDIDPSKTYYVENNLNLPILEILSFIFSDKDIKLVICQDIVRTPDEDQIPIILNQFHCGKNNLHRGINETIRRIKNKYNWTGLTKDVEKFIKSCETCQKTKILRKNLDNPLVITETPRTPFERINIDVFEIPTRNYALTIRDELTKFTQAYPIQDKTAKSVVNTLLLYFQHYGTPLRIHCDYGREFDNRLLKDLCTLYNIKLTFSSVNHPQSNGSIERFHATLIEMIRANKLENPNEHPLTIIPYAVICYNNSVNKTHGFTPYELLFGHTSSRPPETLYNQEELISKYVRDLNNRISHYYKIARTKTELQKEKAKTRFDKHVNDNLPEYKVGDKVYVKESQIKDKLQNKFNGPFEIKEILRNSAILFNPQTKQSTKINFDRMKPYFEN